MIKVAVVNESTVLTDKEVRAALPAFNKQMANDVYPSWGTPAHCYFYPKNRVVPANYWQMILLDDSDQEGALGYHDVTADFRPIGKIFAKTDLDYGLSWTVTFSHELLEMVLDPDCVRAAQVANTTFVAYELCDPCEADQFGYEIDGVLVSDFILPSFFQPQATKDFDFMGHIKKPLQLLPGGYMSFWTPAKGWQQAFAQKAEGVDAPSRRETMYRAAKRNEGAVELTGGLFLGEEFCDLTRV